MLLEQMSKFKQRLTVGGFGTVLVLFAIAYATNPLFRPIFIIMTAVAISYALWEYYHIAHGKGLNPLSGVGIAASALYVLATYFGTEYPALKMLPGIVLFLTLCVVLGYFFRRGNDPFTNTAVTFFGLIYLTVPLSFIISIAYFFPADAAQDGRVWLLYLLFVTKLTDVGAYIFGKLFGKTKFVPYISPKKTWEGAIGGLAVAVATSIAFQQVATGYSYFPPMQMTFIQSIIIGIIISILAQFGDLAESLLKRDAGVKDSSHLPGLGGMLDVVDSLIFTSPFVYFLMRIQF